ncbi:MAG: carboxylating nicotinate-nucleotide diphosphorylase [Leptospiraceae bacterium]|nr:carboxylating nicotinate-nucleotide diphosphorylase [Leptospiraceae bacterium]
MKERFYTKPIDHLTLDDYLPLLEIGLQEDAPEGDITSESIFEKDRKSAAVLIAKESGILCGLGVLEAIKHKFPNDFDFQTHFQDGESFSVRSEILEIKGNLLVILLVERVMLNILQYLSGIATTANQIVKQYPNLLILDTRKTLPAYRKLVKYAVYKGGGANHRLNLSDMAMIKDNHVALCGSIAQAVEKIRMAHPTKKIELEVDSLSQLEEAIQANPDIILLDNFTLDETKKAVKTIREKSPHIRIECSGGITPEKLKALSELGEIGVSMGYLTHTTRFLDLSLEIEVM